MNLWEEVSQDPPVGITDQYPSDPFALGICSLPFLSVVFLFLSSLLSRGNPVFSYASYFQNASEQLSAPAALRSHLLSGCFEGTEAWREVYCKIGLHAENSWAFCQAFSSSGEVTASLIPGLISFIEL